MPTGEKYFIFGVLCFIRNRDNKKRVVLQLIGKFCLLYSNYVAV